MSTARAAKNIVEVLLVEDSPADAELMIEALKDGCWDINVSVIDNGEDALAHLRRAADYALAPLPHLILLDLYLPRMNGHELLAEIKQDAQLRHIPIVIMTGADNEEAIMTAYDLHANCCVPKPADQEQFALAVRTIENFWLRHASYR